MVGHQISQCPFLTYQEQACATYGQPYNQNHPGFQWNNPMGSSIPSQYFARDVRPNQPVYNPQQYVPPPARDLPPPPVQQTPNDPMAMLKLLLDKQRASKKTMEDLANRRENLERKNTFPAQPIVNPRDILPRPDPP